MWKIHVDPLDFTLLQIEIAEQHVSEIAMTLNESVYSKGTVNKKYKIQFKALKQ